MKRGNGIWHGWEHSQPHYIDPLMHHGERIASLETTVGHHHDRLEDLEEAAEELRRHASRSLGSVLEGWLPDLKWLIIIALLAGAKFTLPDVVRDILSGVSGGGLGFG